MAIPAGKKVSVGNAYIPHAKKTKNPTQTKTNQALLKAGIFRQPQKKPELRSQTKLSPTGKNLTQNQKKTAALYASRRNPRGPKKVPVGTRRSFF